MKVIPTLIWTVSILTAHAAETLPSLTLKDGTVLRKVEIQQVTSGGIRVSHDSGGGLIPLSNFPEELKKKYAAAVDNERRKLEETAAAKEKEKQDALRKLEERDRMDRPCFMECAKVIPCHTTGIMAGPGFRYSLEFTNQSGSPIKGTLLISGTTHSGKLVGGDKIELSGLKSDFTRPLDFELFTGPPIRHGDAGITGIFWTFRPEAGAELTGRCLVPNELSGG